MLLEIPDELAPKDERTVEALEVSDTTDDTADDTTDIDFGLSSGLEDWGISGLIFAAAAMPDKPSDDTYFFHDLQQLDGPYYLSQ